MKSTSPVRSAATRVAGFWIGVNTISVTASGNSPTPQ